MAGGMAYLTAATARRVIRSNPLKPGASKLVLDDIGADYAMRELGGPLSELREYGVDRLHLLAPDLRG